MGSQARRPRRPPPDPTSAPLRPTATEQRTQDGRPGQAEEWSRGKRPGRPATPPTQNPNPIYPVSTQLLSCHVETMSHSTTSRVSGRVLHQGPAPFSSGGWRWPPLSSLRESPRRLESPSPQWGPFLPSAVVDSLPCSSHSKLGWWLKVCSPNPRSYILHPGVRLCGGVL